MADDQDKPEPAPTEADVERAEAIAQGTSSLLDALWLAPEHKDEGE